MWSREWCCHVVLIPISKCRCMHHHWKVFECLPVMKFSLQWRHNGRNGVSKHRCLGCLHNRLLRRRSKKTPKIRVTGLCGGIHRWTVNSPHKWPITRKMFPFDDVIMWYGGFDYIHTKPWDALTHPCPNFNDGLAKLPLQIWYGYAIQIQIQNCLLVYQKAQVLQMYKNNTQ